VIVAVLLSLALPVLVCAAVHHLALHAAGTLAVAGVLRVGSRGAVCAVVLRVVGELLALLRREDGAGVVHGSSGGDHLVAVDLVGALDGGAHGGLVEAGGRCRHCDLAVDLLHLRLVLLLRALHALLDRLEPLHLVGGEAEVLAVLQRCGRPLRLGGVHRAMMVLGRARGVLVPGAMTGVGILSGEDAGTRDQQRGGSKDGEAHLVFS
jgi:hypothetical protein